MLISESTASAVDGPFLSKGPVSGISQEIDVTALAADLSIKGNASASRTITLGQQVSNADIVNLDLPNANARVNGSAILTVGATQTNTGAKTFNDQTLKLRNPADTFSYTLVHSAIAANRNLTVPLLTANDTIAVLAEAQTLTNKTLGTATTFSVTPTINSGVKFSFVPTTTAAGMNVGTIGSEPTTLVNGDIWLNSTDQKLRARINGVTFDLASGGSGGAPVDAQYLVTAANTTLTNEVVVNALTASIALKGDDSAGRTITIGQQVTNADTVTIDVPVGNLTLNGSAVPNLVSTHTFTNKTLSTSTSVTASISWGSGVKQTFAPNGTTAGVNIGSVAGDPSTPANGDLWYNTSTSKYRGREGGVNVDIRVGSGSGGTLDQAYDFGGAGAGRAITGDTGAVTITVPNSSNNRALELTQNDTTNNPQNLALANAGTGAHIGVITSDQDLRLVANGTGLISLGASVKILNQGELRLMELTASGSNYVGFKAPGTLASDKIYTLPTADGSNGQFLMTDGSGVLSWGAIGGSWVPDSFTGDGSTVLFTLSATPSDNDGVFIFQDGVAQVGGVDFTISGTSVTFTTAPANGIKINARTPTSSFSSGGGSSHTMLSTTHTDTAVGTVVRGDLIFGNSTPNWARLALGASGRVLRSDGTDVNWAQINLATDPTGVLPIANGGTNSSTTLNNNRIMVSSSGGIVEAAALTNGQLLIGSTGAAPVAASLTAGANITITPGAGAITIAATGSLGMTTVQEEGSSLTQRAIINFIGTALTAVDNAGSVRTDVTLSQSPAGSTSVVGTGRTLTAGAGIAAIGDLSADRTIALSTPVSIANGGTNSTTALNNNRIMVSSAGAIVEAAAMTNGQLLIGSTSAAPIVATLTSGSGILIVNAAGSITISASGAGSSPFTISDDISPSQITSDQNDYNPTGLSTASVLRLTSDATRNITGIVGGTDGRILIIHNVGANDIVLNNQHASSSAANRFLFTTSHDVTLTPDASISTWYDSTTSRWRATISSSVGKTEINSSFGVFFDDTDGATITFDMNVSNRHKVTLGGNRTLVFSSVRSGQSFILRLQQDGTGSRLVTWPAGITWAGAAAPTLTTTAGRADSFAFMAKSATTYDGFTVGSNIG